MSRASALRKPRKKGCREFGLKSGASSQDLPQTLESKSTPPRQTKSMGSLLESEDSVRCPQRAGDALQRAGAGGAAGLALQGLQGLCLGGRMMCEATSPLEDVPFLYSFVVCVSLHSLHSTCFADSSRKLTA